MTKSTVKPANGKLGVLVVGLGAVTSTFMTGVLMARKGLAKPVGSMTQYDKIRVGKGADKKYLHYKDIVPMADLNFCALCSAHGMFILQMLIRAQSMLKCFSPRISSL